MIEHEQPAINVADNKLLNHEEFLNRIKKTLYYGSSSTVKCTKISRPLADYAADIFSESHRGHSLSRLNFVTVGNLTVTPCSLILAMIYLDRLNVLDPAYARRITPSELFIVSMMVSTKFYSGYDEDIYLSAWADSGNMSVDHMKELELEFLDAIGWRVYVSNHEFFEKLKSVERVLAKRQGTARGWLTYTELINFIPTMTLAKQILNYSAVIALSYTASVMTIAGAFFLASNINVPGNVLFRGPQAPPPSATAAAPPSESVTSPGVGEPSGQNCTLAANLHPDAADKLTLQDCECTLQMAIESVQLLNRAYFNANSHFEHHHHHNNPHKAEYRQRFAPPSAVISYGTTSSRWKHFRFIYPAVVGGGGGNNSEDENDAETDEVHFFGTEEHTRNCTYDEFIPLLANNQQGGKPQCARGKTTLGGGNPVYTSYKRTFEMFSSFLKFL